VAAGVSIQRGLVGGAFSRVCISDFADGFGNSHVPFGQSGINQPSKKSTNGVGCSRSFVAVLKCYVCAIVFVGRPYCVPQHLADFLIKVTLRLSGGLQLKTTDSSKALIVYRCYSPFLQTRAPFLYQLSIILLKGFCFFPAPLSVYKLVNCRMKFKKQAGCMIINTGQGLTNQINYR
jgi:hypothetical protein